MLSALGSTEFLDTNVPVPGKSEFGMDTLVRKMTGYVGGLVAFIAGLNQGDTYSFGEIVFYLQSWTSDDGTPIATVTLNYKGLKPGEVPEPDVETEIVAATGQTSADFSGFNDGLGIPYRKEPFGEPGGTIDIYTTGATLEFTYDAAQTTYRYITEEKPDGPTFDVIDIIFVPTIKDGRMRVSNGETYGVDGPEDVFSPLEPVPEERVIGFRSKNVVGSPYYECEDIVRMDLVQATP